MRSRPDDYRPLQEQIERLEREVADVDAAIARVEASLKKTLGDPDRPYGESEALNLRRELARRREHRGLLADRGAALREKLPTDKARKAADTEARKLSAEAERVADRFRSAWARYVEAMAVAEEAARELSAARGERVELLCQIEDLAARFGIDVARPTDLTMPDAKAAYLLGTLLGRAALGEPDRSLWHELDGARRRQAS